MSFAMNRSLLGAMLLLFASRNASSQATSATTQAGNTPVKSAEAKPAARKQQADTATKIEVYGFAQADAIYDFKQNNPDWFDVNRPSRLPAFKNEFGRNGHTWLSARQTRFGVKAAVPTGGRDFNVVFEFDLFGVGPDAGQFTIRPRHMYGQWGKFGAGQTNSPFMDVDVFPNILDYWGPNGMLFFRNVMVFWQPINRSDGTRATLALERPGASGDGGVFSDRIEIQDIKPRFPAPDISGEYRLGQKWGYIELGGMLRWFKWDDVRTDQFDLDGGDTGWGLSLSSTVNTSKRDAFRWQFIYGAGVENYFNDAPIDVGIKSNPGNAVQPVKGEALPDFGMSVFLDHRWNTNFTSALGYARVDIDNSDLQSPAAFKNGQYATINLLYYPVPNIMMGGEFQWGRRENFSDGFSVSDYRLQFSFKYSYSQKFGGNGHDIIRAQD
jgi:hypothetical protein